jgi:hypothetical protein
MSFRKAGQVLYLTQPAVTLQPDRQRLGSNFRWVVMAALSLVAVRAGWMAL